MKFSKRVFIAAGIWGFLVVPPMFFLLEKFGRENPPPITHPEFFYGFAGVTLAWQFVFLMIASDPVRFRPILPAAILEKAAWAATVAVLYGQGRISRALLPLGAVDLVLGALFTVAFVNTSPTRAVARPETS
jgi:hypothetical protein